MGQYRRKVDRVAEIMPTKGKLYENRRRHNEHCPDFTGEGRDCRGVVLDIGLWIVHQANGNKRLDLSIKDIAEPWQVPYKPGPDKL